MALEIGWRPAMGDGGGLTVAALQQALADMPDDALVMVVVDAFDAEVVSAEAGTLFEGEPCCWLITADVKEEEEEERKI